MMNNERLHLSSKTIKDLSFHDVEQMVLRTLDSVTHAKRSIALSFNQVLQPQWRLPLADMAHQDDLILARVNKNPQMPHTDNAQMDYEALIAHSKSFLKWCQRWNESVLHLSIYAHIHSGHMLMRLL